MEKKLGLTFHELIRVLLKVIAGIMLFAVASFFGGGLGASFAIAAIMIVSLAGSGQFASFIRGAYGLAWLGGALGWFSSFFTFACGPMGGHVRQYALLRNNMDFSMMSIGWIVMLFPMLFSAFTVLNAYWICRFFRSKKAIDAALVGSIAVIILIAVSRIATSIRFSTSWHPIIFSAATSIILCVAAAIICRRSWHVKAKIAAIQLLMALTALAMLYPTDQSVDWRAYGIGFWILGGGVFIVGAAQAAILLQEST